RNDVVVGVRGIEHVVALGRAGLVVEYDEPASVGRTIDAIDRAAEPDMAIVPDVDDHWLDCLTGLRIAEPEAIFDRGRFDAEEDRIVRPGFEDMNQVASQRRPIGIPEQLPTGSALRTEALFDGGSDVVDADRDPFNACSEVALENGVDERAAVGRTDGLDLAR